MRVRDATPDDLAAIDDIYHHYVRTSTCTMQFEPGTPEDRRAWFDRHGPEHPVIVAEAAGGQLDGWASLSSFHARPGYAHTVEDSVYLRADARGRGLGTRLLEELLARAATAGHHTVVGSISADQAASLRLHEKLGFRKVAHLEQVGRKFGRWIDVVYLQKLI